MKIKEKIIKPIQIISMTATGYRGEPLSNRKWERDYIMGGFALDFLPIGSNEEQRNKEQTINILHCGICNTRFI